MNTIYVSMDDYYPFYDYNYRSPDDPSSFSPYGLPIEVSDEDLSELESVMTAFYAAQGKLEELYRRATAGQVDTSTSLDVLFGGGRNDSSDD